MILSSMGDLLSWAVVLGVWGAMDAFPFQLS